MLYRDFIRKIKSLNHNLVFKPGRNRASGLYVNRPRYEFTDEATGLEHICGIPSPLRFWSIPKHNFLDGEGNWNRGLKAILEILVAKRLISYRGAVKEFGLSCFFGKKGEKIILKPKHQMSLAQLQKEFDSYKPVFHSAVAP